MPDQADKLRELKVSALAAPKPAAALGIPIIAVTGCCEGVGATTVAVNLAAVLADRGARVALVDAAERNASVARVAGIQAAVRRGLGDVIAGGCRATEALVDGPVGTLVLAHRVIDRRSSELSRSAQQRLLSELEKLGEVVDLIVIDTGSGLTPSTQRLWLRAQLAILVTSSADAAVMDSYGVIKHCTRLAIETEVGVVVNQCDSDRHAQSLVSRLTMACQRFLSRTVQALPPLPNCRFDTDSSATTTPRVWEMPNTPFGHAALWLGQAVRDALSLDREMLSIVPQPNQLRARLHARTSSQCTC